MASRLLLVLALCFGIGACKYILPCYINRYADLRADQGHYSLNEIPPQCTHLVVAFAKIKPENDFNVYDRADYSFFERVNAIKKVHLKNLKTLISIGGPNTDSWMFSTVMKDEQKRNKFCNHLVELIKKFEFDGIDIAWLHPSANDKKAFNQLISCVNGSDYFVTATVSGKPHVIAHNYDVPAMAKSDLAFINVMSFDYHDEHDTHTGMIAPLYAGLGDETNLTVSYALNLWADLGFPKNKIVMGVSARGHGWHLDDPNNTELGAPAHPSPPFEDSNIEGLIAYSEVCRYLYNNFMDFGGTQMWSDYQKVPYSLYNLNFWFSYENPTSIGYKMDFVKKNGFAGAFIYTLDYDDFKGFCHSYDSYPASPFGYWGYSLTLAMGNGLNPYEEPTYPPWKWNNTYPPLNLNISHKVELSYNLTKLNTTEA